MIEQSNTDSVLEFPQEFTIKIMGLDESDFKRIVTKIIDKHVSSSAQQGIRELKSRKNKYISYSITFVAESRQQLDRLYEELNSHPKVLMVL